jgi:hypothetical protein
MKGQLIVLILVPFSGYGADYKEYVRNWSSSGSGTLASGRCKGMARSWTERILKDHSNLIVNDKSGLLVKDHGSQKSNSS